MSHPHEEITGDALTGYWRTDLRCACGHAETIDSRETADAWRSPHVPPRGPAAFRCPACGSGARARQVPDDEDDCAAAMRCWACGHDERELSPLGLAPWRNPLHVADGMARVVAIEREREARATADKARYTDRWPWRPRVRTSPAGRRAHALPAWVEEVMHAPEDPYLRLLGADLVEREDPVRARFMRDQVEAEARLAAARTSLEIETTLRDIACRRVASYSPELARLAAERLIAVRGFARGMVEHVTMAAVDFLAHGDEVLERAPIRFLTLTYAETVIERLAACPWLPGYRRSDSAGRAGALDRSASPQQRARLHRGQRDRRCDTIRALRVTAPRCARVPRSRRTCWHLGRDVGPARACGAAVALGERGASSR